MMWKFWANMPKELKDMYKLVLKNPDLASPLANMNYGDWFTAYGFEWTTWPDMKCEWFTNNEIPSNESKDCRSA